MNTRARNITQQSIRIFLMLFWLYVAVDKLLELDAFHSALQRQPLPTVLVDQLYWSPPIGELLIGLLFIRRYRQIAYLLSASLLLLFSAYIAIGLAGFYPKLPCGCASAFTQLSWSWHLVVNLILLFISILGWYLNGPTSPMGLGNQAEKNANKATLLFMLFLESLHSFLMVTRKRFPEKFALFPAGPVLCKPKLYVCCIPSKMQHAINSPTIPKGRATVYDISFLR